MSGFTSDYEIRMATLAKLGGDTGQTFDSTYSIDLAILEATGSGGTGSYSAGDGIEIENDEISVDTSVIQPKLTAGEGIEISGDTISCTVSGGTGGDAIEDVDVLPDPEENKDKIVRLSTDGKLYYVDEIKAIKFTALADNSSVGLNKISSNQSLEYSTNGSSWSNMTSATTINLNSGDSAYVRGILSANNTMSDYSKFKGSGSLKVSGNINTIWDYTAEDLEAGFQLKEWCGYYLFDGCTGLTDTSELLMPSDTVNKYSYANMFSRCTNLDKVPELPATTLKENSYQYMFSGCTSLITAQTIIPATTLEQYCYDSMFRGCTSLETAPILPDAATVGYRCCSNMFYSCSNLKNIKCLFSTISVSNDYITYFWLRSAKNDSSCTFTKNPNQNTWQRNFNGIPDQWIVVDADMSEPLPEPVLPSGKLGYVWTELNPTVKYYAGTNISIDSNNNISALGYAYDPKTYTNSIKLCGNGILQKFAALEFMGSAGSNGCIAIGSSTRTYNGYETALGYDNISHSGSTDDNKTHFSIGNGTGVGSNHSNAFEIMKNGDIYAYGVGGYAGTNTKAQDATIKTLQEAIPVVWHGTQAEYEQLTPDANTIYLIEEE